MSLRLFARFADGQAHPHKGEEFGDFNFPQIFSEKTHNIVGIVKSYVKPTKKLYQDIFGRKFGLLTYYKNQN